MKTNEFLEKKNENNEQAQLEEITIRKGYQIRALSELLDEIAV